MSGESRSAQADKPRCSDSLDEILACFNLWRLNALPKPHLAVRLDCNRFRHNAVWQLHIADSRYNSRNRRVNGRADKLIGVAYKLTDGYLVADLYKRLAGSADMLLHRNGYLLRHGKPDDLRFGGVFVMSNLNAASDLFDSFQNAVKAGLSHNLFPPVVLIFKKEYFELSLK